MTKGAKLKWFISEILGRELDLRNFDEKLTIQKAVYLAQKMGMKDFEYNFGWHLRGVYSPLLTVDLYMRNENDEAYIPLEEEKNIVNRLLSIKDIIGKMAQTFELISSIVYAKIDRHMKNKEIIIKFIKSVKPWFSDEDINNALEVTVELPV